MTEKCGRPFFGRRNSILGHCALAKGHVNFPEACAMQVETKETERPTDEERMGKIEFDLNDLWKPMRDLPDDELPTGLIGDEI